LVDASKRRSGVHGRRDGMEQWGRHAQVATRPIGSIFSSVDDPWYVLLLDVENNERSLPFASATTCTGSCCAMPCATFFYQRVGQAKQEPYADAAWVDGASHVKALQDHNARGLQRQERRATERDVWGGWYDAGPTTNKYTQLDGELHRRDVAGVRGESGRPSPTTFGIPESEATACPTSSMRRAGGSILLEPVCRKMRMAACLSVVGRGFGKALPSAATGQTLYGPANTSGTLASAAAFAAGARVLAGVAVRRFPRVFHGARQPRSAKRSLGPRPIRRSSSRTTIQRPKTSGLASGQQEVNDGRAGVAYRIKGGGDLFRFDGQRPPTAPSWNQLTPNCSSFQSCVRLSIRSQNQDMLLAYADAPGATATVRGRYSHQSTHTSMMTDGGQSTSTHHEQGSLPRSHEGTTFGGAIPRRPTRATCSGPCDPWSRTGAGRDDEERGRAIHSLTCTA